MVLILPTPIEIPTRKGRDGHRFAGARFSTSDYGNGSVDMRSFLLRGVPTNGMVRESVMRLSAPWRQTAGFPFPKKPERTRRPPYRQFPTLPRAVQQKATIMQKAIEIQGASEVTWISTRNTEESGAERSLVEKRRTRGGKTADEQQS